MTKTNPAPIDQLNKIAEQILDGLSDNQTALLRIADALERIADREEAIFSNQTDAISEKLSARKDAALSLLKDRSSQSWSDREIARRTGVSAQSVGNWRRQLVADGVIPDEHSVRQAFRKKRPYEITTTGIGRSPQH